MNPYSTFSSTPTLSTTGAKSHVRAHADPTFMTEERLPFTVRMVRNEEDLNKAIEIRHAAYRRHMPDVAETLKVPEAVDTKPGVAVLLAESKLDGSPLGSLRVQTNQYKPLPIEQSIELPDWLSHTSLAQVSRLGIAQGGVGRLVKIALIKASFLYCEQNEIKWAIVAARSPLDRQYAQLHFEDIYPAAGYIPLAHMGNVPHRIMGFEIETGQSRWVEAEHPMLNFFCHTHHPDIDVSGIPQRVKARTFIPNEIRSPHRPMLIK